MKDRFVAWINWHWTHTRDRVGDYGIRSFIHIPVGIFCAMSVLAHPVLPLVFGYWFSRYQRNEDLHTADEAWKDYNGAMIGFFIGAVAVYLIGS